MNFTNRYQLKKPAQNEYYNIDEANENMDVIDAEMGKAEDHRAAENPHSGSVPITRKVAGHELTDDIELVYTEIGGAVGTTSALGDAIDYYPRQRASGTGSITAQGTKPGSPLGVEVLGACREDAPNLVPESKRKFEGWATPDGAVATITQGQTVTEWGTNQATKLEFSGGTSRHRSLVTIMSAANIAKRACGVSCRVKNIGPVTCNVAGNAIGVETPIQPGAEATVVLTGVATGLQDLQIRFSTSDENIGKPVTLIASDPTAWIDKAPDNPYTLVAAGGEARVEGKNLLDIDQGLNSVLGKGDNGVYTLTRISSTTRFSEWIEVKLSAGLVYTFDAEILEYTGTSSEKLRVQIEYDNGSQNTFNAFGCNRFTPLHNVARVRYYQAPSNLDGAYTKFRAPQNVLGSYTSATMPLYTPYTAPQTFTVPELRGIPDGTGGYKVRDELTVSAAGSVDVVRRVKKLVLDGSEAWELGTTSSNGTTDDPHINRMRSRDSGIKRPVSSSEIGNVVASHYIAKSAGSTWIQRMGISMESAFSAITIYDTNHNTTVADWKAYLAAQAAAGTPVTIWCELAVPVVEHIADIDPLTALPEATTLSLDGVSTDLTMTYQQADALQLRLVILRDADGPLAPIVPVGMVVDPETDLPATAKSFGAANLVHGHMVGEITGAATVQDILALQGVAAGHEARIIRLEDAVFSNITGNPWAVTFDTLDGITLTAGCWNTAQQRLEC